MAGLPLPALRPARGSSLAAGAGGGAEDRVCLKGSQPSLFLSDGKWTLLCVCHFLPLSQLVFAFGISIMLLFCRLLAAQ